jgi:hypothetical protein
MFLGQMDELGNTLMKNRVLQQQKDERNQLVDQRDRFQTQDVGLRQQAIDASKTQHADALKQSNDWHTQAQDSSELQAALKANAAGELDDAARTKVNQWLSAHPKFGPTGIQLTAPPVKANKGTFETANTREAQYKTDLQDQLAAAQQSGDQGTVDKLTRTLANFEEARKARGAADQNTETVTKEIPASEGSPEIPAQPYKFGLFGGTPATAAVPAVPATPKTTITRKQPIGGGGSSQGGGGGKQLDEATAAQILKDNGGDKAKARAVAKQRGYSF